MSGPSRLRTKPWPKATERGRESAMPHIEAGPLLPEGTMGEGWRGTPLLPHIEYVIEGFDPLLPPGEYPGTMTVDVLGPMRLRMTMRPLSDQLMVTLRSLVADEERRSPAI
jgi:hypothetical protein